MKKKKVILNLSEDVHHRFQELYGRSVGVSAAIRALMEQHLKKIDKQKLPEQEADIAEPSHGSQSIID